MIEKVSVALPHALTKQQSLEVLRAYVQDITKGQAPVLIAPHWKQGNFHAHLVFVPVMETEPAAKERAQREGKKAVRRRQVWTLGDLYWPGTKMKTKEWMRLRWMAYANEALRKAGSDIRINHLSYKRRGIQREPSRHIGPERIARELRRGVVQPTGVSSQKLLELATGASERQQEVEIQELELLLNTIGEVSGLKQRTRSRSLIR
ncbi:MAG: MobA/MobL family protein [Rhodospirillaceae bacterium]|nr:MobA/MobL family protein [Rhodospirillaceae bacterium]